MQFTRERAGILAASTAAFGLAALLRKIAVDRIHPLHYQVVSACVYLAFLPLYIMVAVRYAPPIVVVDWRGVAWTIAGTVVASAGGILFGYALQAGNDAGVVTSLSSISPIITMFLSFMLLGERPSLASAVGCALVLGGVALISFRG